MPVGEYHATRLYTKTADNCKNSCYYSGLVKKNFCKKTSGFVNVTYSGIHGTVFYILQFTYSRSIFIILCLILIIIHNHAQKQENLKSEQRVNLNRTDTKQVMSALKQLFFYKTVYILLK